MAQTDTSGVGGGRQQWPDLPEATRSEIERRLGDPVVSAVSLPGGFSPGLASRLTLAGGSTVFVKAVSPALNPESPAFHRREATIAAALPADAPAPRLLWSFDEGAAGWVVLAFEAIDAASPPLPWRPADLDRVIAAIDALGESLTPSPVPDTVTGRAEDWNLIRIPRWSWMRDAPPEGLDNWSLRHLDLLVRAEEGRMEAARDETLLHLDLRADNMLLTADRVLIVDWPHARIGAPFIDLVGFAPSLAMQGGPAPDELFRRSVTGRATDPDRLRPVVAAIAGFFTMASLGDPVPGLPTLRAFQAAQAVEARRWLARLIEVEPE
ncbi:MAG TPA: phosphotransferase [Thermomicrobiales bacterium]|jgi:aminoglycoside phosphotransferase (APT) family kinase protein|nr:phosphotransferase [Thermomicrobiales bacterium]